VGSIWSRHVRFEVNSMVAAGWQMLIAGIFCTGLGTVLGQWPQFHLSVKSGCALAYLVTGGSLLGYTCFIYLIDHVPVAKVSSYTYVNPVVAVLLGIFLLHERPESTEFAGMAAILLAVYLLTTAQIKGQPEELEQLQAE
jgi:drug/metabolite transporter (DMT)-like permease